MLMNPNKEESILESLAYRADRRADGEKPAQPVKYSGVTISAVFWPEIDLSQPMPAPVMSRSQPVKVPECKKPTPIRTIPRPTNTPERKKPTAKQISRNLNRLAELEF